MKKLLKLYWPMAITFLFLIIYGLLFGTFYFGEEIFENDAFGVTIVFITLLLVIGVYGEMIYCIIKAANNKELKHNAWWCISLYLFHIFIIPYFYLKHICGEKKVKGRMFIFAGISILMFIIGFLIPGSFGKSSNEPLIFNYEDKVSITFPSSYKESDIGEYDFYFKDKKRDINFGGFVYDEDDSEIPSQLLTQRDRWIKSTRGPVTIMDEYYKDFDDSIVRGKVYIGYSNGVRNMYYIFTIEFKDTDTFVNVIAVNLHEDYLYFKDEFFKIFENMEYIGRRQGL